MHKHTQLYAANICNPWNRLHQSPCMKSPESGLSSSTAYYKHTSSRWKCRMTVWIRWTKGKLDWVLHKSMQDSLGCTKSKARKMDLCIMQSRRRVTVIKPNAYTYKMSSYAEKYALYCYARNDLKRSSIAIMASKPFPFQDATHTTTAIQK